MSIKSPKVSIGLPVYNGEHFLPQALDSILEQTFTDFELIISDNASTDQTEEICRAYAAKDSRISYYRCDENIGAARNFNYVFELAKGEYFKWAGDDDVLDPTFLARCVEILDNDSSAVLCHSKTIVIDAEGQPMAYDPIMQKLIDKFGNPLRKPDNAQNLGSPKAHERYGEVLMEIHWCWESHALIRAEQLRKTSLHGTYYGSDKVLLTELSLMGRFEIIPEPLFFNRRHFYQSASLGSAREREIWINPAATGKAISPRLSCLRGYILSILKSDISITERIRCFMMLTRWLVKLDNWERLMSENPVFEKLKKINNSAAPATGMARLN